MIIKFTYPGVACSIINAGAKPIFIKKEWKGLYVLAPHDIVDGALRFRKDMYIKNTVFLPVWQISPSEK